MAHGARRHGSAHPPVCHSQHSSCALRPRDAENSACPGHLHLADTDFCTHSYKKLLQLPYESPGLLVNSPPLVMGSWFCAARYLAVALAHCAVIVFGFLSAIDANQAPAVTRPTTQIPPTPAATCMPSLLKIPGAKVVAAFFAGAD